MLIVMLEQEYQVSVYSIYVKRKPSLNPQDEYVRQENILRAMHDDALTYNAIGL